MSETFTFRESYELLQINPKSFQEWLKKAGIDASVQVDKFDPRKKYLTKEQLLSLAEAHGRVLPSLDDEEVKQPNEALADQLTAVQQQQAQRFEQIDRVLAQVITLVQEMATQQRDLQQVLIQTVSSIREPRPEMLDEHSNGTQKAVQQEDAVVAVASQVTPSTEKRPTMRHAKPKASAKKKKAVRGKKLPAGLVLLRDFAGQHHVVTERASTAGKSGKITVTQGKWLVNSRWATEALDAQGQQDFYEVFHEREEFTPCEHCPHRLAS
jgi:hypothetical protein